jgi:hypothetical protein
MQVRIETQAFARHYTLLVLDARSGERVAEPITGIPAWAIVKVREDLFNEWCNSGIVEVVTMGAIPELKSLEVAGWKR